MIRTGRARDWAGLFRAAARPALVGTPLDADGTRAWGAEERERFVAEFADERGHRRAVDRPVLCALLGLDAGPAPSDAATEVRLWHAVGGTEDDWAHRVRGGAMGDGPLVFDPADDAVTIELRTEAELCALHALDRLALRDPAWAGRVASAAAWHVAELQPDNATGHPWAVQVFARLADAGDTAAQIHAEGLVHACCVGRGHADRFSAVVLMEAARGAETH